MRKLIVFIVSLILPLTGCAGVKAISSSAYVMLMDISPHRVRACKETEKKIRTVKIGMTKTEAESIMGKPERIYSLEYEGIKMEIWQFKSSLVARQNTECSFDKKTEKVIEVIANDYYNYYYLTDNNKRKKRINKFYD